MLYKSVKHFQELLRTLCVGSSGDTQEDGKYETPCLFALIGLLCGISLFQYLVETYPDRDPTADLLIGLIPFQGAAFIAAVIPLSFLAVKTGFRTAFNIYPAEKPKQGTFPSLLKLLILIYPAILLLNMMSALFCRYAGIPVQQQGIEMLLQSDTGCLPVILAGLAALVAAPVSEELIFRLVLYRTVRKYTGEWAVVITSALFAAVHGHPQFLCGMFMAGLLFQYGERKSGLAASIALHSIFNLISFVSILVYEFI